MDQVRVAVGQHVKLKKREVDAYRICAGFDPDKGHWYYHDQYERLNKPVDMRQVAQRINRTFKANG